VSLLILILLSTDVIAKVFVWDLLVCLEDEGQKILGDLASCCQQVNQILDIGIEFPNVIADSCNLGVQGTELFLDMEDCASVDMALMDDEKSASCMGDW